MNETDLSNIDETNSIAMSDSIHSLRKNDYSVLLSSKSVANALVSVFSSAEQGKELQRRIASIKDKYDKLASSFITKKEVDSTYVSKETLEAVLPSLLTRKQMESLLKKYVSQNDLDKCKGDAEKLAQKLADEMTDFVGAAMVGINSSGAAGGTAAGGGAAGGGGEGGDGNNKIKTVNKKPDNSGHIRLTFGSSSADEVHNEYDHYIYKFSRPVAQGYFEWYRTSKKY